MHSVYTLEGGIVKIGLLGQMILNVQSSKHIFVKGNTLANGLFVMRLWNERSYVSSMSKQKDASKNSLVLAMTVRDQQVFGRIHFNSNDVSYPYFCKKTKTAMAEAASKTTTALAIITIAILTSAAGSSLSLITFMISVSVSTWTLDTVTPPNASDSSLSVCSKFEANCKPRAIFATIYISDS